MGNKLRELYNKYFDLIPYAFFGVCTTLVNIVSYWVLARCLKLGVMNSTYVAWFLAVLFAYLTNRKYVFHSGAVTKRAILTEIIAFFVCRLGTGFLDWACMYVFVNVLHFNDIVIKTIANILVIVFNYIASKFVIFKKR